MSAITAGLADGLAYLSRAGGGATPIVLLHGIGSRAQSFARLMEALADRCPAVAWDAPGYGESQPLAAAWPDASDYAGALLRLLDRLDVVRCVLLGHSLGALIAARLAVLAPQRVAALLLAAPALGYRAEKGAPLHGAVARRIEDLDRLGADGFAAARAPSLLGDPGACPELLAEVESAMAAVRRPGYDQAARMLATGNLLDDAAKIEVPTAVLVGSNDRITPPEGARRAFGALRASAQHALREFPGAGHALYQEQPREVARAIIEIVNEKASAHA